MNSAPVGSGCGHGFFAWASCQGHTPGRESASTGTHIAKALRVVARRRGTTTPGGDLVVGQAASTGCAHRAKLCRTAPPAGPSRFQGRPKRRWPPTNRSLYCSGAAGDDGRKFAERPHRCRPRTAATCGGSGSVQRNTGQWCHQPGVFQGNRGQHKQRNLPVGLGLVFRVVRPRPRQRASHHAGLLVVEDLSRLVVLVDPRRPAARPADWP